MQALLLQATFLLLWTSVGSANPIFYIATDHTGAQTQVDVEHTPTWTFTPIADFTFGGGLFERKEGRSTSADLHFSLYQGSDASGVLLGSLSLTESAFCAQVSNCGQFQLHQFLTSAIPLVTGTTYFAQLTSGAVDTQDEAYFIKSVSYFIADINGDPVGDSPIGGGVSASVIANPEPSSMVLLGLALAGLATKQIRRRGR